MRALFGLAAPAYLRWRVAGTKTDDPSNLCKTADIDFAALVNGRTGVVVASPAGPARTKLRHPMKRYMVVLAYGLVACAGMAAWVYFLALAVLRAVGWLLS